MPLYGPYGLRPNITCPKSVKILALKGLSKVIWNTECADLKLNFNNNVLHCLFLIWWKMQTCNIVIPKFLNQYCLYDPNYELRDQTSNQNFT